MALRYILSLLRAKYMLLMYFNYLCEGLLLSRCLRMNLLSISNIVNILLKDCTDDQR
jgi:hypothetical protein